MFRARIENQIFVEDAPEEMLKWARMNLVLDNPDYYKKVRMGKWVGGTPEHIYLYQKIGDTLALPFGCIRELHKNFGRVLQYDVRFAPKRDAKYSSNIKLYDYQENATRTALGAKNGILVMPCGSGKTQTALEIISRVGGRVLWLTHTQDLLHQSMIRAKSVLDTTSSYGTITGGKVNIGSGITFATVQTMCKLDLAQYKDAWDIIIVDECQHCCGSPTRVTQFYKVVSSLSARYKIGLTATPKRADGLHESMFALLGDIIYEVKREDVAHTTCPIKVKIIETGYEPDYNAVLMGDGTLDYTGLITDMIENENRFQTILGHINDIGKSVLVLASRVQYIQNLHEAFKGKSICLSTLGTSKSAKAERKEALRKLNDGEIDAVFATYQLAKEGLDVPNLRYVVFATPEKDETTIIQSAGRVGRKADGKECGAVIDFIDDFPMYRKWARQRQSYYKKIDAEIIY